MLGKTKGPTLHNSVYFFGRVSSDDKFNSDRSTRKMAAGSIGGYNCGLQLLCTRLKNVNSRFCTAEDGVL